MTDRRRALILGINGQDGSFLADILLGKGYEVHGLYRRSSVDNLWRLRHISKSIQLHPGDLSDISSVGRVIAEVYPQEIYNEADQDHVGWSYHTPVLSMGITAGAVAGILELVREINPRIRVFQPVSATMFGDAPPPQNEATEFNPQSPYACAKLAAYYLARYYRQAHGMFVSTAILFNHDSPRRCGQGYLLHDICSAAIRVAHGQQQNVAVGDLDMIVDIGYAREYMEAAWNILQLPAPDDFVIGSGTAPTIRYMATEALRQVGVPSPESRLEINPAFLRPGKQPSLRSDISKARAAFGFCPKVDIGELITILLDSKQESHA